MIKLRIDVTKITKEKLYTGKKGTYLNCVMIETPNSEYSDYMIVEESTKEERENGSKGAILGNASTVQLKAETTAEATVEGESGIEDDLPF